MKLRWQVILALIVPVVLAMAVAGGIVAVYLRVYYVDSISTISDSMKGDQQLVLGQISQIISMLGSSALQGKINPILIGSHLIRNQTETDLKPDWKEANNAVNGPLLSRMIKKEMSMTPLPVWNSTADKSYYFAMWGLGKVTALEDLNSTVRAHLRLAASFDYYSQSMMRLVLENQAHLSFEADGFFYYVPAMFKNYFYDPPSAGYNETKCARTLGEARYDPRCRPFYMEVKNAGPTQAVVPIAPYLLGEKKTIGQGACAPMWSGNTMLYIYCNLFDFRDLVEWMKTVKIGSAGYSYMVTRQGRPYVHPKFNESWADNPPTVLQLEFSDDISYESVSKLRENYANNSLISSIQAEIGDFNSTILPQLQAGVSNITSYDRLGQTYIAGLHPLSLKFSMDVRTQYLCVAVVMEITEFTSLYNTLIRNGEEQVTIAGIVLGLLLFFLIILGAVLAVYLSHFLLRTLRDIVKHINGLLALDYHRHIASRYILDDVKVMYDLLRFIKHITRYNADIDPEIHELLAVLHDFSEFREIREFLICCKKVALKCLEDAKYKESIEICLLLNTIFQHGKTAERLQKEPAAMLALIQLIDVFAVSLLELDNKPGPEFTKRIAKSLKELYKIITPNTDFGQFEAKLKVRIDYLRYIMEINGKSEPSPSFAVLHEKYGNEKMKLREERRLATTEKIRRVVFATEFGVLMKGNTIENVISLVISIVERLSPKDMFGYICYAEQARTCLPIGSLKKLPCIRAVELFNQPRGTADFYTGLIAGVKELKRNRKHAMADVHFPGKELLASDFLVVLTTGKVKDASKEEAAMRELRDYTGKILLLWLKSDHQECVQDFQRVRSVLNTWKQGETSLTIVEISTLQSQFYPEIDAVLGLESEFASSS